MFIVIWVLKALWIISSKTIKIGIPPKFYHRVMHIAPSSGHEWLNLNLPFTLISKEVWGCSLMSGVRILQFLKDWWKFIQIHLVFFPEILPKYSFHFIGSKCKCAAMCLVYVLNHREIGQLNLYFCTHVVKWNQHYLNQYCNNLMLFGECLFGRFS